MEQPDAVPAQKQFTGKYVDHVYLVFLYFLPNYILHIYLCILFLLQYLQSNGASCYPDARL